MGIVFRDTILSGFDLGFGDRTDAIIEISILEHWRSVLLGAARWNQPFYFHPYTDTLGYNDGYLLSGVVYSGWRLWFDPFVADTMTALTYKSVGFVAILWLVRGVLRWSWGAAILIATLATIANNMFLQSIHAQIQTLALLPIVAGLAIKAARAETSDQGRTYRWAIAAAAMMGLWLVTSFYFAWFTIYFSIAFVACWLWVTGRWRSAELARLFHAHRRTAAVFVGVFVLAAIPFVLVYAPKMLETGGHGFVLSYTVQPTDLVNTGERNLLWGWLVRALAGMVHTVTPAGSRLEKAWLGGEHEAGFPLLLFALTCAAAYRLVRRRGDTGFARVFALAIVISWALTLRIWQVSPWILVHYLVPAASGLRVVLRYQLFLVLPVLLLVGTVFRHRLTRLWRRRPVLAAGLIALLILEQINLAQPAQLSRKAQFAALDAVPAPPTECHAFYVVVVRPGEPIYVDRRLNALYPHNVDAMFLAERWRLPTLNGFSTFNPPDWNVASPEAADYDARVMAYARKHRLAGLCRLDMRSPAPWRRVTTI
ncbi:hypothetical protein FPZ24_00600 [Sphingomonas panacisoli]|uniref:Glycosyltransferase RgtA/B/C/D-like domain-containing protein n=1 Tax=Sphingomonas panacisoli TaxID=1813879 RepID=A0A5B8LPC9_9SPHN|nr:hypothetical protein FPZ24_00600 [Sphingomonas panacisoli]